MLCMPFATSEAAALEASVLDSNVYFAVYEANRERLAYACLTALPDDVTGFGGDDRVTACQRRLRANGFELSPRGGQRNTRFLKPVAHRRVKARDQIGSTFASR